MKLGTVTIGQTPRSDLVPEIAAVLGPGVRIVERGALDGLTRREIEAMAPGPGDYVLVTRLRDGSSVQIAEKHVLPRLQSCLEELEREDVAAIALLCTGEFPPFRCRRLLVKPQPILYSLGTALGAGLRLGVLVPAQEQVPQGRARWGKVGASLEVRGASPYADSAEGVESAARELRRAGVDLVIMDCVGYTGDMKKRVRSLTGAPVLLARTVVARVLAEIVA